jgi:hypothetical protein
VLDHGCVRWGRFRHFEPGGFINGVDTFAFAFAFAFGMKGEVLVNIQRGKVVGGDPEEIDYSNYTTFLLHQS